MSNDNLAAWPKAETHVHLEGSIAPGTLREIDPSLMPEEIARRFRFRDFAGFLQAYIWVTGLLRRPEHYALATRRLLQALHEQGVAAAEVTLSAGVILWRGQDLDAVFQAVQAEATRHGLPVGWVVDAVRQFGTAHVEQVLQWAIDHRHSGVIGFGVGGDEASAPTAQFVPLLQEARRLGLLVVPHAGETAGPESVWAAVEAGAHRIGHGIRSVEDPVLVRHLRDRQVPLEICVTSNVRTGVVPSLKEHPVRLLFDAGVPLIINTDDPALFGTSLLDEYRLLANIFRFTEGELRHLAGNSMRFLASALLQRPGAGGGQ